MLCESISPRFQDRLYLPREITSSFANPGMDADMKSLTRTHWTWIGAAVFAIGAGYLFALLPAPDWRDAFYPAGRALLSLRNPYDLHTVYNPPYIFPPLALLALPGSFLGKWLLSALSLAAVLYTCHSLKADWLTALFYLLSAPVWSNLMYGNLEALLLLALFLPPAGSLVAASVKPQTGIGLMLYPAYFAWREQRFWRTLAPLILLGLLSLWAIPAMLAGARFTLGARWNMSIFPFGLPFAVLLIYLALRHRRPSLAMAVGPFLSPYVNIMTWAGFLIAVMDNFTGWKRRFIILCACLFSWAVWIWVLSRY